MGKGGNMNIRRFIRLSCLSVMGLFWASCGSDSDSSTGATGVNPGIEPESSSDALGGVSSDSPQPSSSSSEEQVPESSSGLDLAQSSSSDGVSSSSVEQIRLARDPSITCTKSYSIEEQCPGSTEPYYSCTDLQEFLKKDTTVSEKILNKWEDKLMSCGAVQEPQTLYGVVYRVCPHYQVTYLKCSDGKMYKPYADEDGIAYITKEEYYETHSSSSVAESSSSSVPEDLVTNCPRDSFALFVDVLADVQKEVYGKIVKVLDENDTLLEVQRVFLDSIINREKETLRGNLFPYYWANYDYEAEYVSLKNLSDYWFDGYVAKTKTCAEGTPETTALYRKKYEGILQECLDLINKELERIGAK